MESIEVSAFRTSIRRKSPHRGMTGAVSSIWRRIEHAWRRIETEWRHIEHAWRDWVQDAEHGILDTECEKDPQAQQA